MDIFSSLVPLEIIDSTNANVYEKYGIDFTGNCYSCDLAKIKVNDKQVDFVNICDENEFYRIEDFTYTIEKNELRIKTKNHIPCYWAT